jgi:SAM-dependent methyltransferase
VIRRIIRFNASRVRLWEENAQFAQRVPAGARVLDAGAGEMPYKSLFAHAVYESADFLQVDKPYELPTYVCDLQAIPVEDGRFDFVVFNQVMEHLPEPGLVLRELYRVLKPGGEMIYSGPLFFEEHEQPFDFYRYTQFGLRYLFAQAGFVVVRLGWLEGYWGTAGYQLNRMGRYLPYRPHDLGGGVWGVLLAPFVLGLKGLFVGVGVLCQWLELRVKYTERGYPKNYVAIVRKEVG